MSEFKYYRGINTVDGIKEHFSSFENRVGFFREIADFSKSVVESKKQFTPNEATILGLTVRMYKLYNICFNAYLNKRNEEITLFNRMMYESYITLHYLIKNGSDIQKKYRLVGYCNHFKLLNDKIITNSNVFGIKQIYDIRLHNDGFTIGDLKDEFAHNKNGKIHEKGFRGVFEDVTTSEDKDHYLIFYGFGSDSSHPNWNDSLNYDVEFQNGYYIPKLECGTKDGFNEMKLIALFLLDSLILFQEYFKIKIEEDVMKFYSVIHVFNSIKSDDIIFVPIESIENININDKNIEITFSIQE